MRKRFGIICSMVLVGGLSQAAEGTEGLPSQSKVALAPCTRPGMPEGALCGTLEVYENRAAKTGRKIPLSILVLPATGKERVNDPLVHLAGGPGDSSVRAAPWVAQECAAIREHRDLLFVDQRGTGGSYALEMPLYGPPEDLQSYLGDFLPVEAVKRGRADLEKKADLTQYTTSIAADDLDEVREALGYDRLNLFGASYGTRLALEYARRHPERARTLILGGVNSPSDRLPLPQHRSAQDAIEELERECAADPACNKAFPEFRAEFDAVLDRLDKEPVHTPVLNPATGEVTKVSLSRALAAEAVRYMMYSPEMSGQVPTLIHAAAKGDFTALAEMALFGRQQIVSGGIGIFLTILCSEDIPGIQPDQMEKAAQGSFWRNYRYQQLRAACDCWPKAPIPADFNAPVTSQVPALLLNGAVDPATGPEMAKQAGSHLPSSRVVIVPGGAHWFSGMTHYDCIIEMMTKLVAHGSTEGLDLTCVATMKRPPFIVEPPQLAVIAMSDGELTKYSGKFKGESVPFEVALEVVKDKLRMTMPDGRQMLLAPVSPTRFRLVGAPGYFFDFEVEGQSARRLLVGKGTSDEMTLVPAGK